MNAEQSAPLVYDLNFFIFTFAFIGGFLVLFTIIYFVVCKLVSLRGWQTYAPNFPGKTDLPADAQWLTWQSIMIGGNVAPANYQFAVAGGYDDDGIHLKMGVFFKAFHPPLFIPWDAVELIEQKKAIKGVYTTVNCSDMPRLVLFRKFGDAVFAKWQTLQNDKEVAQ